MKKVKKTTVIFFSLMLLIVANFSVALGYQYNFTITRGNTVSTGKATKNKTASYGKISVISSSASAYYTTYYITTDSNVRATKTTEVKNTRANIGKMNYYNPYLIASVKLKGVDARMTAPNYSTVSGYWSPTENIY